MSQATHVAHAVLGTAGHIDHGKSSLVKALTGTDPDRFKEEQDRGMTIDIGFAEYETPEGVDVGLIDVPGHERFIRNMVAGASGMDMVMLVIAADDSVMPQTREHLEIMTLLGLQRGCVVVTKVDMVDSDMVELVEEEVKEFVAGTFLEGAPVLRCSSITGEGLEEVREVIHSMVLDIPPRDWDGVFRMPIQRAFTIKGHGTVVTGVPLSGGVSVGDQLQLLPQGLECRIRGLHVHHKPAEEGGAGLRTAINISDIGWRDVHRGDVIAAPGYFSSTRLVEARFSLLPSWKGLLKDNIPVRFHVGCTEALGRLVLLDAKRLEPGADALVQIRLDDPVVVAPGDHYLLRLASPERTLGGGLVLGETRYRFKRFRDWITENMKGKEEHLGDREAYLEYVIRSEGLHPVPRDRLALLVKDTPAKLAEGLQSLLTAGRVIELKDRKHVMHADMVARGSDEAQKALLALHEADHYPFGFKVQAVASHMKHPPGVVGTFLEAARASKLVEEQRAMFRLKAFKGGLSKEDRRLLGVIEGAFQAGGFATPSVKVLAEELDKPLKRVENILTLLQGWNRVVQIDKGVWLHRDVIRTARDQVVAWCQEHGALPSNQAKDLFGATRKYVIPLLEYFDSAGLTVRADSSRSLKDGYESVWTAQDDEGVGPASPQ
ncbi:MAG: selenocysteine-specific translation elongation factor [Planctomycetes bacterium]|nr:selenocysteine-specific translation elongation factor [Planctomycetota bacterium]